MLKKLVFIILLILQIKAEDVMLNVTINDQFFSKTINKNQLEINENGASIIEVDIFEINQPVKFLVDCRGGITGAGMKVGTLTFSQSNKICEVYLQRQTQLDPFLLPQGKYPGSV